MATLTAGAQVIPSYPGADGSRTDFSWAETDRGACLRSGGRHPFTAIPPPPLA